MELMVTSYNSITIFRKKERHFIMVFFHQKLLIVKSTCYCLMS